MTPALAAALARADAALCAENAVLPGLAFLADGEDGDAVAPVRAPATPGWLRVMTALSGHGAARQDADGGRR